MLRRQFPERFSKGNDEFAVAFGASDYPFIHPSHLPHEGNAPVLQFGCKCPRYACLSCTLLELPLTRIINYSAYFRDPSIAPNISAMPPPGRHLGSFYEWSLGSLGHFFRPAPQGELWYKEALGPGHEWDELIPVVIWRGSDFNYLPTLRKPREVRPLEKEGPLKDRFNT